MVIYMEVQGNSAANTLQVQKKHVLPRYDETYVYINMWYIYIYVFLQYIILYIYL